MTLLPDPRVRGTAGGDNDEDFAENDKPDAGNLRS